MNLPEGITLDKLLHVYNNYQRRNEARNEWFKTEEGKAYNRLKAKEYYLRHKQTILEKRAKRYETDRDTLLNRAKDYYANHADEINMKNKTKREAKIETTPA